MNAVVLYFSAFCAGEILPLMDLLLLNTCFLIQCPFQMSMSVSFSGARTSLPQPAMLQESDSVCSL